MTGSPCSTSGTSARHPNLLQQEGCRDKGISDKLRRMAIKNSYESRSLCGSGAGEIQQEQSPLIENVSRASTSKLLPSLTGKQLSSHRYSLSSRSKRPAPKPAASPRPRAFSSSVVRHGSRKVSPGPSSVHDVGASAGDDPKVDETTRPSLHQAAGDGAGKDQQPSGGGSGAIPAHLMRRSTSHSSVALQGSSSLSQPSHDSSSYIYHLPARIISRGRSRSQSRVHAHMHTHNGPSLSLKRSSSHSTVALNRTAHHQHYPSCPPSLGVTTHTSIEQARGMAPSTTPHSKLCTTVSAESPHRQHTPHHHHYNHHQHHHRHHGNGLMVSLSQDQFSGATAQVPPPSGRHNKVFDSWAQDIGLIETHFPRLLRHVEHTASAGQRRRRSNLPANGGCSQPDAHYGVSSSYRHKYHTAHPHCLAEFDAGSPPSARFGTTQKFQSATSVVSAPPACVHSPPHHLRNAHQESVRKKRVTLHPPRGNKVASLV